MTDGRRERFPVGPARPGPGRDHRAGDDEHPDRFSSSVGMLVIAEALRCPCEGARPQPACGSDQAVVATFVSQAFQSLS